MGVPMGINRRRHCHGPFHTKRVNSIADVERLDTCHTRVYVLAGGISHETRREGKASTCSPLRVAVGLCGRGTIEHA
jgi:hypothetical protein